jgi:parallel beta-helix repeat protein
VWFDESTWNTKLINSEVVGNAGHGLSVEISGGTVIAGNYIADNVKSGMKINDVNNAKIWNNTIVNNARPIAILQDDRRASNTGTSGHDPRYGYDGLITWINKNIQVRNNIVSGTTADCLLCVYDYSGQYSAAEANVTAQSDVYQRDSATAPDILISWSNGAGVDTFTSLAAFKSATGLEDQGLEFTGRNVVDGNGTPTSALAGKDGNAVPLPADIAALLGQPAGAKNLGIFN